MKKIFFYALLFTFSNSALAATFLGVTQPFGFQENELQQVSVGCDSGEHRRLTFWAVRGSKYAIPRLSVEWLSIRFRGGREEIFHTADIWRKAKGISVDTGRMDCIESISLYGKSVGIESLRASRVEVWGE